MLRLDLNDKNVAAVAAHLHVLQPAKKKYPLISLFDHQRPHSQSGGSSRTSSCLGTDWLPKHSYKQRSQANECVQMKPFLSPQGVLSV